MRAGDGLQLGERINNTTAAAAATAPMYAVVRRGELRWGDMQVSHGDTDTVE